MDRGQGKMRPVKCGDHLDETPRGMLIEDQDRGTDRWGQRQAECQRDTRQSLGRMES